MSNHIPAEHELDALAARIDGPKPRPLSDEEILAFIRPRLARRDALLATAARYGSPLYVVDAAALRGAVDRFRRAFNDRLSGPLRIYAAVKTNNAPEVAGIFLDSGLGLDVSSGAELDMALTLGACRIIFSGPGKTDAELRLAVENAWRVTVLVDSFGELARLQTIAASRNKPVVAGVRLTTNPNGQWRKFGIRLDRLEAFLREAESCSHVRLRGLQFHTSWNLTPRAQVDFITQLGGALRALPARLVEPLEFIDIGGGYWPETGEWIQHAATPDGSLRALLDPDSLDRTARFCLPAAPIEQFAGELSAAIAEHLYPVKDFTICMEPGRWLCQGGMHLLMTVVDRKYDDLAITDAGMNAVGWERFENDYFPVVNLTRPAETELPCEIMGSLCTPHDLWGFGCWGEDVVEGDVLMIPDQGAYTYSLRQTFIKQPPKVVVI